METDVAAGEDACGGERNEGELIPDGLFAAKLESAERGEEQHDEREGENLNEGIALRKPRGDVAADGCGNEGVAEVDDDIAGARLAGIADPVGDEFDQQSGDEADDESHGEESGGQCEEGVDDRHGSGFPFDFGEEGAGEAGFAGVGFAMDGAEVEKLVYKWIGAGLGLA